jgi:GNAT superfamily N-acetyltransferase
VKFLLEELTGDWQLYRALFLLADEDQKMLAQYIDRSDRWLWRVNGTVIGVAAVLPRNPYEGELMAIAITPAGQNRGTGSAFLQALLTNYRQRGWWTLSVGTGDTGPQQLHFYLQNGFRFDHVRPYFFKQYETPIQDEWGQLRDMVVLKQLLKPLPQWRLPVPTTKWQPVADDPQQRPAPVATSDGTPGWSLLPIKTPAPLTVVGAVFDFALTQWSAILVPRGYSLPADTNLQALWYYHHPQQPAIVVPAIYFEQ